MVNPLGGWLLIRSALAAISARPFRRRPGSLFPQSIEKAAGHLALELMRDELRQQTRACSAAAGDGFNCHLLP
jgi:hypothetical protein